MQPASATAAARSADGRDPDGLTVFYDGACPLCRREIGFYQSKRGGGEIHWFDVSRAEASEVVPGLTRDQALARFHVRDRGGRLVSGGAAFAALWRSLPAFRPLGRLFRLRPFSWILEIAYRGFLVVRPWFQSLASDGQARPDAAYPDWLLRELRSDHAGETGAVAIYRGILTVSRNAEIRSFAEEHLSTERRHLERLEAVLPRWDRSVFLPLWRIAGFLTGALPAQFGRRAIYATIDAVESFVDHHYAAQVERLTREQIHPDIRDLLEQCRQDEVHHRDEAREAGDGRGGIAIRAWAWLVTRGSAAAVSLARRI